MLPTTQNVKTFWQRPEGVTGGLFMAAIVGAIGVGLYKILPYLIEIAENALYLAGLCVLGFGLVYVLLDPKFRNAMWYLYKVIMRKFTGIIVTIDPIEILKVHVQNLYERMEQMNKKISLVMGQKNKLSKTIETNVNDMQQALSKGQYAKSVGDTADAGAYMREYKRIEASNERLKPLQKKLDDLLTFLTKLHKNSGILIRDMEGEIKIQEIEYKALKESVSAIASARSIFSGGEDDMYKQAVNFLEEDMANKLGEIDNFMRTTDSIIKGLDHQNGAYEMEGLKMLEKFDESEFTFLLNKDKLPNSPEKILIPKSNSKTDSSAFENLIG